MSNGENMSDWHALVYPLVPGSAEAVGEVFRGSPAPSLEVTDEAGRVVGRLLGTLAFVGERHAVRVIEVEGPVAAVSAHMGRSPQAREFQGRLQPYLAVDRDPASPESMRAFFRDAILRCVMARFNVSPAFRETSGWHALVYPLVPGSAEAVGEVFRGSPAPSLEVTDEAGRVVGRLLGTLAFVGERHAVRVIEVEGPVAAVSAHMGRSPQAREFQGRLQPYLAVDRDPASPESMRAFFRDATLRCVMARHLAWADAGRGAGARGPGDG
jgi:hypothetical protein